MDNRCTGCRFSNYPIQQIEGAGTWDRRKFQFLDPQCPIHNPESTVPYGEHVREGIKYVWIHYPANSKPFAVPKWYSDLARRPL